MKRALKHFVALLAVVLFFFWALSHLFLANVVRSQLQAFGEKVGYEISVGDVELTPLLLRLRVHDVRLAQPKGDVLFTLKQLEIDARFWPLLAGRMGFDRIVLEQPEVRLARAAGKNSDWNWVQFVDRVSKAYAEPNTKDKPEHSSLRFVIDEFAINGGRVDVRDGQKQAAYDLGPLSLHLTDLTNQDATGHVGGSSLQSKYTLNLGAVKIPLPKADGVPDRQLVFNKVTATGKLVENSASVLQTDVDLSLDDGEIKSSWTIAGDGALTGKIAVDHLAVKPWLSLAPSYKTLDSNSGIINAAFELKQDANALTIDGDVKFDAVDIRVSGAKDALLAWDNTSFNGLHLLLSHAENKPGLMTINDILVDNPKIRFIIDAQRQSNFRSLFSKPQPVTTTKTEAAAQPQAAASQAPFRYDIRSIRLKKGTMYFADESIKPEFRVDVTELDGAVQGVSNEPGRYATLVLNGRAAKTGSLRARGQLAFADPRLNNDVSLIFKNIPLSATNPYSMTFAGYRIDDGRIDVDLRYITKDGQLQGKNRFVIKKIKLGEEVPDYQGTRLPLGLAIALLEDSDGMIDVNIPVKGNVNDPEFSVGHLVWQAVKTVISNVVTAPFRALGALLGIENVDAIAFVPGESALPPDGDEQLTKIAEVLAKRPKSKLVIHGTYDPAVDAPELARAMADRAILEASGIKVTVGEPLPVPNLTDPKVKAGLKSAYATQVGRIKLGQRLLSLPDNAERDTQLRQELIDSYKISEEQLKQLADQRANAVKAKLLSVDAKLSDRVSIGDPDTVSADEAGVPIKVDLEMSTGS